MLYGVKFVQKICLIKLLKNVIFGFVFFLLVVVFNEDLRGWIVENIIIDWYLIGICVMGGCVGQVGGVVDEWFRVYGVKELRVIDVSVMLLYISVYLQVIVYVIGEKGVDMILEDVGF